MRATKLCYVLLCKVCAKFIYILSLLLICTKEFGLKNRQTVSVIQASLTKLEYIWPASRACSIDTNDIHPPDFLLLSLVGFESNAPIRIALTLTSRRDFILFGCDSRASIPISFAFCAALCLCMCVCVGEIKVFWVLTLILATIADCAIVRALSPVWRGFTQVLHFQSQISSSGHR
jgi:hypothetical protein